MRIALSIGYGRLHLISAATFLALTGARITLICGWAPSVPNDCFWALCYRIVGRRLRNWMEAREIVIPGVWLCSLSWCDFLDHGLRLLCLIFRVSAHKISALTWSVFGWCSRRYLRDADIFHCRSGAGQGGAIRCARRRGMKILVDHSALHPAKCAENLRDDYAKWGQMIPIAPGLGLWKNVEKDCRMADVIMVNADHIKDSFVEQGYSPEKVKVVRLGVRSDFFGLKKSYRLEAPVRILFTGNFSILKGAEYMLSAMRILRNRQVACVLDVVGGVDVPAKLRECYGDLPVIYHGAISQDDLKSVLANSDIYLFPSLADGCAQSGMEALAAGLPVVATNQSGLPIMDGVTGCVVPTKDPVAIANKIEWLIGHADERERMGRDAAKMIAENYTWEKYAANVMQVYEMLCPHTRFTGGNRHERKK